ncbi:hypothetical protein L6164_011015 [Bauhinia variegata]|uniref:Uncharacterized protein n=1 Tax=Bauhinia variegata TaxID=167791 RepID=A0ACB9P6N6_BAUVA|nr:hypothetical protein L6164_011015 [Bauhinia variegata]
MDGRFSRESKGSQSLSLQKKMVETTRQRTEPVPDLTDFMNDMFFGTTNMGKKTYDLTGDLDHDDKVVDDDELGFDDSTRSNSGRLTEEWLEEARRIVASSPGRCESPGRLVGSPRFAAAHSSHPSPKSSLPSYLDRRDPLSRSARRSRTVEGLGGEILSKSAEHSRTKSDTFSSLPSDDGSPATAVHRWFSNILKPSSPSPSPDPDPITLSPTLPPRQSLPRKSRFQTEASVPQSQPQTLSRRTFKTSPQLLSPQSLPSDRQPFSSLPDGQVLSPPRNVVESAQRRSISSSTCSWEKIRPDANGWRPKQGDPTEDHTLNGFLKESRTLIHKLHNKQLHAKAKIVLSGSSNSTTSMLAAICYSWLLEHRQKGNDAARHFVVAPVMNVKRATMWQLRQAAWLFHHSGLDATSLLFADEVDLEGLMMDGQLNLIVVGQDILSTTSEVGSQCSILTDNYCEDAYDLLQNPTLKKLLLAGILLDTQNLKASSSISMTRDAEAVQLLLVGSAPNYRYALYDQLMLDQNAASFIEVLHHNYGKPPDRTNQDCEANMEHIIQERKSTSTSDRETITPSPKKNSTDSRNAKVKLISPTLQSPSPAKAHKQAEKEGSHGKNKFFLARWFGFGSK